MKTNIYVDSFNLYYGCLRQSPYKWLDVKKLAESLLRPENKIHQIKFFTAQVSARSDDPGLPLRQNMYFRALKTIPSLKIIKGHFLSSKVMMPLADPRGQGSKYVKVIKTEEKGSDVNIATHLLMDAYRDDYEAAVLISNDSDLVEPIRVVRKNFKKKVLVFSPQQKISYLLGRYATTCKKIDPVILPQCQFPEELTDDVGTFRKPQGW